MEEYMFFVSIVVSDCYGMVCGMWYGTRNTPSSYFLEYLLVSTVVPGKLYWLSLASFSRTPYQHA